MDWSSDSGSFSAQIQLSIFVDLFVYTSPSCPFLCHCFQSRGHLIFPKICMHCSASNYCLTPSHGCLAEYEFHIPLPPTARNQKCFHNYLLLGPKSWSNIKTEEETVEDSSELLSVLMLHWTDFGNLLVWRSLVPELNLVQFYCSLSAFMKKLIPELSWFCFFTFIWVGRISYRLQYLKIFTFHVHRNVACLVFWHFLLIYIYHKLQELGADLRHLNTISHLSSTSLTPLGKDVNCIQILCPILPALKIEKSRINSRKNVKLV